MALDDYMEPLRTAVSGLLGTEDEPDTDVAVGVGDSYDEALDNAYDELPDGDLEWSEEYKVAELDTEDADELPAGGELADGVVAAVEYAMEAVEDDTGSRERGAGAPEDAVEDVSSRGPAFDYNH